VVSRGAIRASRLPAHWRAAPGDRARASAGGGHARFSFVAAALALQSGGRFGPSVSEPVMKIIALIALLAGAMAQPPQPAPERLVLYGGEAHREYLGCVSCPDDDRESIFNEFGTYGSFYGSHSVSNHYAPYGSPYSKFGACNVEASDPPVVVDAAGKPRGRLTMNAHHPERIKDERLLAWLADVCDS
jgi:hypothetical protein